MDSIFKDLAELQSPQATRALSRQLGTQDGSTGKALATALPVLLNALARNASKSGGADSLLAALDRDHDGSILDDLMGTLGAASASSSNGILEHLLGSQRAGIERAIARQTGLDEASVRRLLALVAPLVMGSLGRARQQGNWTSTTLAEQLGAERARAEDAVPGSVGILEELLDADGDGEIGDDIARVGAKLLGSLLGGPDDSGTRNT